MHYSAVIGDAEGANNEASLAATVRRRLHLLNGLGAVVRGRRLAAQLTIRALAERAHVSERFLAQLEAGGANISVARLADLADALHTNAAELLLEAQASNGVDHKTAGSKVVALLGVRGAGKSTLGARVAKRLKIPFVELDALIAREAGMNLSTIFEMHGEAYFRRVEREALRRFLDATPRAVLATGGSLVTDAQTFDMLRRGATTVWLKARPKDHWERVVAQGDGRPMRDRADAMSELKGLLRARKPLYTLASHVVDTSSISLEDATDRIVAIASGSGMRNTRRVKS